MLYSVIKNFKESGYVTDVITLNENIASVNLSNTNTTHYDDFFL